MIVCEVCGWKGKHQGALNLHKVHCRYKNADKHINVSSETKKECEHEWRFLNSNDRSESLAIQNGFSEVCIKCQNLQV